METDGIYRNAGIYGGSGAEAQVSICVYINSPTAMSAYGGEGPDTAPQPKKKKGSKGLPKGIIEHRTKGKLQARLSYKEDGMIVRKNIPGLFDDVLTAVGVALRKLKPIRSWPAQARWPCGLKTPSPNLRATSVDRCAPPCLPVPSIVRLLKMLSCCAYRRAQSSCRVGQLARSGTGARHYPRRESHEGGGRQWRPVGADGGRGLVVAAKVAHDGAAAISLSSRTSTTPTCGLSLQSVLPYMISVGGRGTTQKAGPEHVHNMSAFCSQY